MERGRVIYAKSVEKTSEEDRKKWRTKGSRMQWAVLTERENEHRRLSMRLARLARLPGRHGLCRGCLKWMYSRPRDSTAMFHQVCERRYEKADPECRVWWKSAHYSRVRRGKKPGKKPVPKGPTKRQTTPKELADHVRAGALFLRAKLRGESVEELAGKLGIARSTLYDPLSDVWTPLAW